MSWLSEGIDAAGEWFNKNPELDRKVAFNQMVHRGFDRIRNKTEGMGEGAYAAGLERKLVPSVSDVKASLLGGEDKTAGERFSNWQKETLEDGIGRGWSPEDIEKYRQENDGRAPGPNDYAPGDVEYNKRVRGNELAKALLGPAEKSKMIGTAGGAVQGTYDPRDQAYDKFMNNPEVRPTLEQNEDGTWASGENMNRLMDNQYNPIGNVLVNSGRAGEQSVANYFTHRDDGSGKGMSFLKGLGEMLYDTAAESPQWFGFKGFEQSENGKKIENIQRAAEMSERASPIVGSHDSLEARNADAANMRGMKDKLDYLNNAVSYKNAHGKNPHWLESAAMNTIPMFADWMGGVAGLTATGKGTLKSGLKASAKAIGQEALLEDLPMMGPISVASEAMQNPLEMNQEQVKQIIDDRNKAHQGAVKFRKAVIL